MKLTRPEKVRDFPDIYNSELSPLKNVKRKIFERKNTAQILGKSRVIQRANNQTLKGPLPPLLFDQSQPINVVAPTNHR